MDIEFHYYMTYLIALRAGFEDSIAFRIAYSSQYTDDNQNSYTIIDNNSGKKYVNYESQTVDITKPREDQLNIYSIFHFCPGTKKEISQRQLMRKDGHFSVLDTVPDSSNARSILDEAIKTENPYRIGIATHVYADTFCHRDFSGWKDTFNDCKSPGIVGSIWHSLGPEIGHALAMHQPDIPALIWEDNRMTSAFRTKHNKETILSAAGRIFDIYSTFTKKPKRQVEKSKLLKDLDTAIGKPSSHAKGLDDMRINAYRGLLKASDYDKNVWFDKAVIEEVNDVTGTTGNKEVKYYWKDNYVNSEWFKFQEAIKQHHGFTFDLLRDNFDSMEITSHLKKCIPDGA